MARRESIFAQIDRHLRWREKMKARHAKHTASGKRRPNTCFECRLELAKEGIEREKGPRHADKKE